jgi:hypothetical protein
MDKLNNPYVIKFVKIIKEYQKNREQTKLLLQIHSDLHLEFYKNIPKIDNFADCLILAGDIGNIKYNTLDTFLSYVSKKWKYVIYVPGNHEYYNQEYNIDELKKIYRDLVKKYDNIHFLDDDYWDHPNNRYRFIGSTGWSNPKSKNHINGLNDFNHIKNLTYEKFIEMHNISFEFIKKTLHDTNDLIPIIITHFPPLQENTSHPKYAKDINSSYFANDLHELDIPKKDMDKIPMWISGHTHYSYDITIDKCRFVSNQLGYNNEYKEANGTFGKKSVFNC